MEEKRFSYAKEIPGLLREKCERILRSPISNLARMPRGEINYVFKITAAKGDYVARIHQFDFRRIRKTLDSTEKILEKNRIPHARTIFSTLADSDFPHGFEIAEFIRGSNGQAAIEKGMVSFEIFHTKLAELLKKINGVKLKSFGSAIPARGNSPSFLKWRLGEAKRKINEFKKVRSFPKDLYERIKAKVEYLLNPHLKSFFPVLNHGDASPANCIWTSGKEIVLVDWDNARVDIWLSDFSWLTYCGSHLSNFGSLEERRKRIRKAFLAGYAGMNLKESEIDDVERGLHILRASDMLDYYFFVQKNQRMFRETKKRLDRLLKTK